MYSNWSSLYECAHGTVLYNCALRDDGPVRPETCMSLCILKHYCDSNDVCVFVGLLCNNRIIMRGMESVKLFKLFFVVKHATLCAILGSEMYQDS
jgi:hypothetical protein